MFQLLQCLFLTWPCRMQLLYTQRSSVGRTSLVQCIIEVEGQTYCECYTGLHVGQRTFADSSMITGAYHAKERSERGRELIALRHD